MPFQQGNKYGGQTSRGQGAAYAWLMAHRGHADCACLFWPFGKEKRSGRGIFGHEGKHYSARVFMCELAHGPKPSPSHHATLSCVGGRDGCVSPQHLSWQTQVEVLRRRFARIPKAVGGAGNYTRLSRQQIIAIQAKELSQLGLAHKFQVSVGCIQYWQRDRATRGHHIGPVTRRRILAVDRPPLFAQAPSHSVLAARLQNEAVARISDLVPRMPGREDICNDILLAVLQGNVTIEDLQRGGVRPFITNYRKDNFESSGYAVSLDVPMRDGRNWHDVLAQGQS